MVYGAVLGAGRLQVLDPGQELVSVAFRAGFGLQALPHQALVLAAGDDGHGDLRGAEPEDHGAQQRADHQQQDEVEGGHAAVQDRRQGTRGEDLPDGGVALQPHHQVTGGPAQEERVGQVGQVPDEPGRDLPVQVRAQVQQDVGAHQGSQEVIGRYQCHRDGQDYQQVPVAVRHDAADHDRGEQRDGQRQHLHQRRQDHRPAGQDPLREDRPQVAVRGVRGPAAGEACAGLQDDRHPGVGRAEGGGRNGPAPQGRVHHRDALPGHLLEHDEVVEVPVQDRSPRQAGEVAEVGPDRPRRQAVAVGGGEDPGGIGAVPPGACRLPQFRQGDVPSVIGQGHAHAGGGAVSHLELRYVGNAPTHRRPPIPNLLRARRSAAGSPTGPIRSPSPQVLRPAALRPAARWLG